MKKEKTILFLLVLLTTIIGTYHQSKATGLQGDAIKADVLVLKKKSSFTKPNQTKATGQLDVLYIPYSGLLTTGDM